MSYTARIGRAEATRRLFEGAPGVELAEASVMGGAGGETRGGLRYESYALEGNNR